MITSDSELKYVDNRVWVQQVFSPFFTIEICPERKPCVLNASYSILMAVEIPDATGVTIASKKKNLADGTGIEKHHDRYIQSFGQAIVCVG